VIFSVLDHNAAGDVYVDGTANPRTALVVLEDTLFLTGEGGTAVCEDVVDLLEREISTGKEWDYWNFYCMSRSDERKTKKTN